MADLQTSKNLELFELDYVSEKSKSKIRNLTSIQVLRGVAVLMVGFAHLHSIESKLGGQIIFGTWFLNGFAGVDLFFLISGFVMVYTTRNIVPSKAYIFRFLGLRLFRIYPLWWAVCGAIYIVFLVHPEWVYSSSNSHPDILKSFFLIPQNDLPFHAVGWTLIHELWFYAVFGLLILAPRKALFPLLIVWAILTCLGALLQYKSPFILLITHPLTIEFIAGCLCALAIKHLPKQFGLQYLILAILTLISALFAVGDNPNEFFANRHDRVILFTIPFATIILAMVSLERNGTTFPRFFKSLGDWSYSFYLLHVPIFAFVGRVAAPFSSQQSIIDNIIIAIIALGITIVSSAISYSIFEKPIAKLAHNLLGKSAI